MLALFKTRWSQFLEESNERSVQVALGKTVVKYFHLNRLVVPVYKDLTAPRNIFFYEAATPFEFLVINRNNIDTAAPAYRVISRRSKGLLNVQMGYFAFAASFNGEIIADIWCASPRHTFTDPIHPDLAWLGITSGIKEVYMYDMYVAPEFRGKAATTFLLGSALNYLKKEGFEKVYGFYEKNNFPALWTHRLFGYTELENRRVSRILMFKISKAVTI